MLLHLGAGGESPTPFIREGRRPHQSVANNVKAAGTRGWPVSGSPVEIIFAGGAGGAFCPVSTAERSQACCAQSPVSMAFYDQYAKPQSPSRSSWQQCAIANRGVIKRLPNEQS